MNFGLNAQNFFHEMAMSWKVRKKSEKATACQKCLQKVGSLKILSKRATFCSSISDEFRCTFIFIIVLSNPSTCYSNLNKPAYLYLLLIRLSSYRFPYPLNFLFPVGYKTSIEKTPKNVTNATAHLLKQEIWRNIWKHTVENNQTNATNVTMHPLKQAIWGHIWKHTVEKSQTNATNVIMHLLGQAIWGYIWKYTVGKSQTHATDVIMHPLIQAIWGHIWK